MTRSNFWYGVILLAGVAAATCQAQEWTRFRGPNGTGESEATTIPATWTADDYNWHVPLPGVGHSSTVHWGDKIFLTSALEEGRRRLLLCLNATDGKILWQQEYPATTHPIHKQNSYASSTPAVDEERVYAVWATHEKSTLVALDHDGKPRWEVDLGPFEGQHGFGTSPIVYQDLVILNFDQDGDSFLMGFDRETGAERWRTPRRSAQAAYSTPCMRRGRGGLDELIFNSEAHGIAGVDPANGHVLWEISVFDKRSVSSPIVAGGLVFGSCGSGAGGNYVVAVEPGAQPRVAYKIDRAAPYVPTSVVHGELMFLWADNGLVSCLEAKTGKQVWQRRVGGTYSSSPIRVADRLYCVSGDGEVLVLAAGPEFQQHARIPLGETCRSSPSVAGGRLYLRTVSHLYSLGGKS